MRSMRSIHRKGARSAPSKSEFQSNVPYQAEIVKIIGLDENDENSDYFTIKHKVNVNGHNIIYSEKFYCDLNDRRVKELLDCLAPYGVTGDNLY